VRDVKLNDINGSLNMYVSSINDNTAPRVIFQMWLLSYRSVNRCWQQFV